MKRERWDDRRRSRCRRRPLIEYHATRRGGHSGDRHVDHFLVELAPENEFPREETPSGRPPAIACDATSNCAARLGYESVCSDGLSPDRSNPPVRQGVHLGLSPM